LAILELSSQIALLQAANERLSAELSELRKAPKKKKRANAPHPVITKWKQRLLDEKHEELMHAYADRIAAIQRADPGWTPPKRSLTDGGKHCRARARNCEQCRRTCAPYMTGLHEPQEARLGTPCTGRRGYPRNTDYRRKTHCRSIPFRSAFRPTRKASGRERAVQKADGSRRACRARCAPSAIAKPKNLNPSNMEKLTNLGRIDRAVAENIPDIRESFGEQASLVQDFIVFIFRRIKYDPFGFTKFALADFCEASGRNRQDLAVVHPIFAGTGKKPPEIDSVRFETVFDYCMATMVNQNLVFRKAYRTTEGNRAVSMESMRILSDVHVETAAKGLRRYSVRISPELMHGFVNRYYTLDTEAYMTVGKGKGGSMRKSLVIYLSRMRHIAWSSKQTTIVQPMEVLCRQAGVAASDGKLKKQAVSRLLDSTKEKGNFAFDYKFLSGGHKEHHVCLYFTEPPPGNHRHEHAFLGYLMEGLEEMFRWCKGDESKKGDKAPFQSWLADSCIDQKQKVSVVRKAYEKAYSKTLEEECAYRILASGFNSIMAQG